MSKLQDRKTAKFLSFFEKCANPIYSNPTSCRFQFISPPNVNYRRRQGNELSSTEALISRWNKNFIKISSA